MACTAVVESDIEVEIPMEFRLHEHQVLLDDNVENEGLLAEGKLDILGDYPLDPLAQKFYVELSPPNLMENASDYSG